MANKNELAMRWRLRRALRIIVFALMLAAGAPCGAWAQSTAHVVPFELRASVSGDALFFSATYIDDPKGAYDIDDVSRGNARNAFAPFPAAKLNDRVVKGWFRFALRVPVSDAIPWTIGLNKECDVFDIYYPRPNGTYAVIHAGMLVPFAERGTDVPNPNVPISPELANGQPIYAYVVSNRSLPGDNILFYAVQTKQYNTFFAGRYLGDTFFGGLFFAILVTNLFLAFYLRDRTFFAYVVAMALHVLTQFTQDATSWRLLWPNASLPYTFLSVLAEELFFVSLAVFWRSFLNLRQRAPVIDRVLLGIVGLTVVRSILVLVVPQTGWLPFADFPLAYGLIITALVAAIAASRDGYRPARFLIVALGGLLFFWGVAYQLEFPLSPGFLRGFIQNSIYYGVAWDALFLTFALADRIETAKRGMIAAQQQALVAQTETVERLEERDAAVSRFVPQAFLQYLGRANVVDLQLGDHVEREMTILFSDIRSFTTLSESMTPEQTFGFLNAYLRRAGPIIRNHDGFIDKYIGDALMGLFPNATHTAVDAAIEMQRSVHEYNRDLARAGQPAIAIGVGLHRGMLMLGTIGESARIETTVIADAVNVAARTESLTKQFRAPVIASASVIAALDRPQDYKVRSLGNVVVYGASRGMEMFEIFDGDAPELLLNKVRTLDDFAAGVRELTDGDFSAARDSFDRVLAQSGSDRTAAYFSQRSRLLVESAPSTPWDGLIRMDVK